MKTFHLIFLLVSLSFINACSSAKFMLKEVDGTNATTLRDMTEKLNSLKARISSLDESLTLSNGDLYGLTRRLDSLNIPKNELDSINSEISDIKKRSETLNTKINKNEDEIAKIERQVAENNMEMEAYEKRREELESDIANSETQLDEIKDVIRKAIQNSQRHSVSD